MFLQRKIWVSVVGLAIVNSYTLANVVPPRLAPKLEREDPANEKDAPGKSVKAKNKEDDCGPNCVFALLRLGGIRVRRADVIAQTRSRGKGSSVADLVKCARHYELNLSAVHATPAQLESVPLPAIVHLDKNLNGHFCVLTAVGHDYVEIIDGTSLMTNRFYKGKFLRDWSGVVLISDEKSGFGAWTWWIVIAALTFANCCVYVKLFRSRRRSLDSERFAHVALSSVSQTDLSVISSLKRACVFIGVTTVTVGACLVLGGQFQNKSEEAKSLDEQVSSTDDFSDAIRREPLSLCGSASEKVRIPLELLDLVLTKTVPVQREKVLAVHELLHALRIWKSSLADVSGYLASDDLIAIVTDSRRHDEYYSRTVTMQPLLFPTRFGFGTRIYGGRDDVASTSHFGNVLQVLGEVGIPSDYTIYVESRDYRVADGLVDLMARFNLEDEIEFATVAFCHYLPPTRRWKNRHGEEISFDAIARRLVQQESGACYGVHRLYSLVVLLKANHDVPILSNESRVLVVKALKDASKALELSQRADGLWERSWNEPTPPTVPTLRSIELISCTGHHLEWIAMAPQEVVPGSDTIRRAVIALATKVLSTPAEQLDLHYGPLSHAANALMLLSQTPPRNVLKRIEPKLISNQNSFNGRYPGEYPRISNE